MKPSFLTATHPDETASRSLRWLDYAIFGLIGLFPVLFLLSLQLAGLLALLGLALHWRTQFRGLGRPALPHWLLLQFALFFLVNALVFESWPGNRTRYYGLAIEAWTGTTAAVVIFGFYFRGGRDLWPAFRDGLPVGMALSVLVMTGFFIFGDQGPRVAAWGATPLGPPMWYLALSLLAFAGFERLSASQQGLRYLLFALAALMALYGNARLIFLLWAAAALVITCYSLMQHPAEQRWKRGAALLAGFALCLAGIVVIDQLGQGYVVRRMQRIWEAVIDPASIRENFLRVHIWGAAYEVARENVWLGVGQINERLAIHQVLEHTSWFRAHQTYLSYVISGGVLALLSGLLFQMAPLVARAGAGLSTRMAVAGFVLVCALNGLTDSVFQSFTNVQGYALITLALTALGAGQAHIRSESSSSSA